MLHIHLEIAQQVDLLVKYVLLFSSSAAIADSARARCLI